MNPMRDILSWTNGRTVLLGRRLVRPERFNGFLRCNSSSGIAWYEKIAAILSNTWVQGAPLLSPTSVEKGSKNSESDLVKTLCFGKVQACRQHTPPQWRQTSRACETLSRPVHHPVHFEASYEDRWASHGFRFASTLTSQDAKERPDRSHQRQATASSHGILAARDLEEQVSQERSLEEETRLPDPEGGGRTHATITTAGKKVSAKVLRGAAAAVRGMQSGAEVLSRTAEENIKLLMFMGGSAQQITRFFNWYTDLHHRSVEPTLPKVFKEYRIDSREVLRIEERLHRDGNRHSHLFFRDPLIIRETLEYLEENLGVGQAGVAKVIVRQPTLLHYKVAKLKENRRKLEALNLSLETRLVKCPALLTRKPETMRQQMKALQQALGSQTEAALVDLMMLSVNAKSIIPRIQNVKKLFGDTSGLKLINKRPRLLIAKEATVTNTYEELTKMVGRATAQRMIESRWSLLSSAWNTLEQKIQYFTKELDRKSEEWERSPVLLGYSLEKRIKPRLAALMEAGGHVSHSLVAIMKPTDAEFKKRFGVTPLLLPRLAKMRKYNKVVES